MSVQDLSLLTTSCLTVFLTDSKGRTRKSATVSTLCFHHQNLALIDTLLATVSFRDHQYPGEGPGKLEEEICVLDSGTASRGQGGRQGPLGCTGGQSSAGSLGEGDSGNWLGKPNVYQPFFLDTTPVHPTDTRYQWVSNNCVYERDIEVILGDEWVNDAAQLDPVSSRCFNCGSSAHLVSSCPSPLDRQVISLSRQLYNFLQAQRGANYAGEPQRIHVIEGWKHQRFQWLESFEPGHVQNPLLKEALGSDDDGEPWLKNMAIWGYPPGWAGETHPRGEVRLRIQSECSGWSQSGIDDDDALVVFGDGQVDFFGSHSDSRLNSDILGLDERDEESSSMAESASASDLESDHQSTSQDTRTAHVPSIRRWAKYPPTHFSSDLLPVYSGRALPPISSSTFTEDRRELWREIVVGHIPAGPKTPPLSERSQVPPWRLPSVFAANRLVAQLSFDAACTSIPPPPACSPPPLPPLPPSDSPPPSSPPASPPHVNVSMQPPTSISLPRNTPQAQVSMGNFDEIDMDLSDPDE
jgi:zinc finger CCHC domain-containing protein 8